MTLEERIAKAMELRRQGYCCSQSVLMAFDDLTELDDDTAASISMGLGGGVGGMKEICGVVTAMALTQGMIERRRPQEKGLLYASVRELADRFREDNDGRILCRDLKYPGALRPCNELIADGIRLLHEKYTL